MSQYVDKDTVHRAVITLDIHCSVIAPFLIPKRPGELIKTNRKDSVRLAQLYWAGKLTSIVYQRHKDEALRDLVRCREDAKEDDY